MNNNISKIIENFFKRDTKESENNINKIPDNYRKILFYYCRKLFHICYINNLDIDYKKLFKLIKLLYPFDLNNISPIDSKKLTELQLTCIEYFHYIDTLLLALPTGSGKTLIALCCALDYLRDNENGEVIVISPASVLSNFEIEANKNNFTLVDIGRIKFFSYDSFMLDNKNYGNYNCNKKLVIIDEAHTLRSRGIKYNYIMECVIKCDKVLLLTATPIVNTFQDIISLINLLTKRNTLGLPKDIKDEEYIETESQLIMKESVKDEYVTRDNPKFDLGMPKITFKISYSRDPEIKKQKELEQVIMVKHFLNNHIIFKNKESIYDENYPKYELTKLYIKMDEEYENQYYIQLFEGTNDMPILFSNPDKFYHGFRRAVNKLRDKYYSKKLNSIIDKLINSQSIIYTNWLEYGAIPIQNILIENNIKYDIIKGNTLLKDRNDIVKKYNNKEINVVIITKAGSEGLDFKNTENLIIIDPPWGYQQIQQIIGRAVRYKSHINLPIEKQFVNVYYLILYEHHLDIENNEDVNTYSGDIILYNIYDIKKDIISITDNILDDLSNNTIKLINSTLPLLK